jgi:uncharacterized C2H2 Zn-finger protein
MQKIHTNKPDLLKCIQCQVGFKNQASLADHNTNVDCQIRCPDCDEVFDKKAQRIAHHNRIHPHANLLELNDYRWEKLNQAVKAHTKACTEFLKKGTGSLDPLMMAWIHRNTPRFMEGRLAYKVNPLLELGQWYVMFCALSSVENMVEHPCEYSIPSKLFIFIYSLVYDYLPPAELAVENILCIFEKMVVAKVTTKKLPPQEIHLQIPWYKDILQETLQIARRTRYIPQNRQSEPDQGLFMENTYDQEIPISQCDDATQTKIIIPLETADNNLAQLSTIDRRLSASLSSTYYMENPQQSELMPRIPNAGPSSAFNGMVDDWENMPHMPQIQPNVIQASFEPQVYNPTQNFDTPQGYNPQPNYNPQPAFGGSMWQGSPTVNPQDLRWKQRERQE